MDVAYILFLLLSSVICNTILLCTLILRRRKIISRDSIESMSLDICYHIKVKNISAELLSWNLSKMLMERGVKTDHVPLPRPHK